MPAKPRNTSRISRRRLFLQTGNVLPEGYELYKTFSLSGGWRLLAINLGGAALFFLAGWLIASAALYLRPNLTDVVIEINQGSGLALIAENLAGVAFFWVCHEAAHALARYYYTRTRPILGWRLFYAYTAQPDWYLPRGDYAVVALAPLVGLTLLGGLLLQLIPLPVLPAFLFGLTMNAAASVGDLVLLIWIFRQPSRVLIEDLGDTLRLYYSK